MTLGNFGELDRCLKLFSSMKEPLKILLERCPNNKHVSHTEKCSVITVIHCIFQNMSADILLHSEVELDDYQHLQ